MDKHFIEDFFNITDEEKDGMSEAIEYVNTIPYDINTESTHCLEQARALLIGDRLHDYGKSEENFERIRSYWNTYISHTHGLPNFLEMHDIAMLMALFKLARLENGYKEDSCIDMCAYINIYNELKKRAEDAGRFVQ